MNEFVQAVYYSLPWLFIAGLSLAAVAGIALGLAWPRLLVYPYLAIYFCVNSTSYGNMAIFATRSIYSRGSGMLYFGLLLWYVLGAWACARVAASFQGHAAPACNLRPWFLGWLALLAGHVCVATMLDIPVKEALSPQGFSNIVWMAPLVSLMLLSFRTREHAIELGRFILLVGLGRALFGLVRWAAFGGDPNNVYANLNAVQIRLTFFDINDSLVCLLAFAIAAVHLFQHIPTERGCEKFPYGSVASPRRTSVLPSARRLAPGFFSHPHRPRVWRAIEWVTLGATGLCILLSYRRTAWIGFRLALLVVTLRFPVQRRLRLALGGLPLVGAALAYLAAQRLSQTRGAGGGLSSLVYDMQSRRFGPESERVLELKLALSDILAYPLTGIGSWGRYTGYQYISWQNNLDGGLFVHSGLLHVALKSGLPGTVLLCGTIGAFVLCARRALATAPPELLGLATAGVAGLAFMLPDFLLGTPFPQVRTTQMLAVCLALPYVALAVAKTAPAVRLLVRPAAPHARLVGTP